MRVGPLVSHEAMFCRKDATPMGDLHVDAPDSAPVISPEEMAGRLHGELIGAMPTGSGDWAKILPGWRNWRTKSAVPLSAPPRRDRRCSRRRRIGKPPMSSEENPDGLPIDFVGVAGRICRIHLQNTRGHRAQEAASVPKPKTSRPCGSFPSIGCESGSRRSEAVATHPDQALPVGD